MKKLFTPLPVLTTIVLSLILAVALMLLPKAAVALAAAVLFLAFTGLYFGAPRAYASYRTSDDTIKNLIVLRLCNAAGFGHVACIEQTVAYSSFTDGGSTAGTYQMLGPAVPAGALLLGTRILVPTGFTGDTSATVTVGDGSDVDRYMTGTPSVFTTAATGIDAGVVSGLKHLTASNRPTITITSGSDWGLVTAGSITVQVYFIATAGL